MNEVLNKIADMLWTIPNMSVTVGATIMNPIDTEEHAKRLLSYLIKNKNDKEIMRVSFLLKHNHEIIGN